MSTFISPMLAKESAEIFEDPGWIYEIKWDGYRAVSEISHGKVKLYSRNGLNFALKYPAVYAALMDLPVDAVMDGEIVVLNDEGYPDFQKLQHYEDNRNSPLIYYVFDLLYLNGKNLEALPLLDRKALLKKLLPKRGIIKFSDHITGQGKAFFQSALQKNLEGIMAKKADSEYLPGARTSEWLKIKNHKTADVIIAGYTQPTGSRKYFGSLLLGIKKGDELIDVGHAGSGYNEASLKAIYDRLQPLKTEASPFSKKVKVNAPITWVKPVLVCEVKFTEWTSDEKLRHPVFLQIRDDKSSKEIKMSSQKPVKKSAEKKSAGKKSAFEIVAGKVKVPVSNPDKIYFPKDKISKRMVVEYYQSIAPYILPFLKDRPESLKRNPNGINDAGFFHKDAGEKAPDFIQSFGVHSESTNKQIDYIICNDKATLAYLNNLGCIELNPWHSTKQKPDHPDYMIIDIDPSDKNNFDQVVEVANAFKKLLDKAGAKSFCKTSGASGLHIYVPMKKKYTYEEVKNFAQLLCMMVEEMLPDFTTMERNLKKRGNKKIYLDHLQNRSGQTISSVYSLRPKEGATVSMPLQWKEVKKGLTPKQFTIHNALKRIKKDPGIFKGVLGPATNISSCLKKLGV